MKGDRIKVIEIVHNSKLLPVPWLKVDIHTSRWLNLQRHGHTSHRKTGGSQAAFY